MNKAIQIGNLTRDPELRTLQDGTSVCSFTIAVSKRKPDKDGTDADFFRVTVWRQLGEICAKYLAKGRKVCVVGPVTCRVYTGKDGLSHPTMEINADEVEFLSPRGDTAQQAPQQTTHPVDTSVSADAQGFVKVENEELPF